MQTRIHEAYQELSTKPQDWVRLARLREKLGNPNDAEMKQILLSMTRTGLVHLAPDSNRKALKDVDHAAAVRIGSEHKHLIAIEPDYWATLADKADDGPSSTASTGAPAASSRPDPQPSAAPRKPAKTARARVEAPASPGDRLTNAAAHVHKASTRDEAAKVLNGLTKKDLAQVAKSLDVPLRAGKKADQVRQLVDNTVGARLEHETIRNDGRTDRPATPSVRRSTARSRRRTTTEAAKPDGATVKSSPRQPAAGTQKGKGDKDHAKHAGGASHAGHTTKKDAGADTARPADLESRIRVAYRELSTKKQDWVRLSRLWAKLGNPDKPEREQILRSLTRTGMVHLAPDSNRKAHTDEDRAGAIRIGSEDKHLIAIEEPDDFDY